MQYRTIFWISALFLCCHLSSCRKADVHEVPFVAYVTIPAGLNTFLTHYFVIPGVPGLVDSVQYTEAQPTYIRLNAIYGEPNLDFIQHAYLEAITDTTTQEMGYRIDAPITGATALDLIPSIIDLKDHVNKPTFAIQLKTVFRAIPTNDTQIRIDFTIRFTKDL